MKNLKEILEGLFENDEEFKVLQYPDPIRPDAQCCVYSYTSLDDIIDPYVPVFPPPPPPKKK